MDQLYRQNIIDHYKNPRHTEVIKRTTHSSEASNITCGDETKIWLNIEDGIIKEIKHETRGCALSIAGISILSEYVIGKKFEEIKSLDSKKFEKIIGIEVSPSRLKCILLGLEAIKSLE